MSAAERFDVPVAGGTLATFRFGAADDAPVVVAVHGITANSHGWLAVSRALDGRATLLAPDIRGRGRSNALPAPYGMAAHARDVVAVLDYFGLERAVLVGHSLGAYVVARAAVEHPERAARVLLVDGGLTVPVTGDVDPQKFVEGFLGPALARLKMTFASREEYHAWWRRHPAFVGHGGVDEADLVAYAEHDLVGEPPRLRSSVDEVAVRGDAAELFEMGEPAHRLSVPATLVCAPRGLLDDPNPMQPMPVVEQWVTEAPDRRRAVQVPDVNHYTLVLGRAGAAAVADVVAEAAAAS